MGVTSETHEQKPEEAVILETVTEVTPTVEPEEVNFTDALNKKHLDDRDKLVAMFERVGKKLATATTYQEVDDALADEAELAVGTSLLERISRLHFEKQERDMLAAFVEEQAVQNNTTATVDAITDRGEGVE